MSLLYYCNTVTVVVYKCIVGCSCIERMVVANDAPETLVESKLKWMP